MSLLVRCRRQGCRAWVLCCAAALGSPLVAAIQPPAAENGLQKTTSQWFETIEPGGTVRVVNPFGNVYARFGGYEDRVEVLATSQRLDAKLPELEVRRSRAGTGLDVVVEPGAARDPDDESAAGVEETERRDRIDLVVFVPRGATLDAQTRTDLIEAKGLKGDLVASSVAGDIRIRSVTGRVRAKTARGRNSATHETGVTTEPQELTTVTGEIEVFLWEDARMVVTIATSGEISTDFSIHIEHRRFEEPGKHARALVGEGGPALTLTSKRGRVRLLRLQRDFKPEN